MTNASSITLTRAEQEQARELLTAAREGIREAVEGLSEAQWNFRSASERWSIAENLEHVVLVQDRVRAVLVRTEKKPGPPDRDVQRIDAMVIALVPERSSRFPAPEAVVPTGRWTPAEALDLFTRGADQIAALVESAPDLRQNVVNHPAFGPLDEYQWVLAAAGHTVRHTHQIREVKADPGFPKA